MIVLLILKGFIIGIGKIIPGISGSVIAISMGIYDKIIYSFSTFFKSPKNNFKFLIKILIGVSLAMILGSKIIHYLVNKFYVPTVFTILGFVLGTIPTLIRKTKYNSKNIVISIISFIVTFFLTAFKINININTLTIIFLGIIEAFTSIVPGISGTAIFINFGVYDFILEGIGSIDINFLTFYIFGIGIGLIIFSKLINLLIEKYNDKFSSIINGLVIASLVPIIKNCFNGNTSEVIIGSILLIVATSISYLST